MRPGVTMTPGHVLLLRVALGREIRADRRDFAIGEGDIELGIDRLRGIDDPPAGEDEIVGHGRGLAGRAEGGNRASAYPLR